MIRWRIVVLCCLCITSVAEAQTPRLELTGAYHAIRSDEGWLRAGWSIDAAVNLGPSLGIVAEIGGVTRASAAADARTTLDVYNFGLGTRWTVGRQRGVMPFGQLLFGGIVTRGRTHVGEIEFHASQKKAMAQGGGGLSVGVSEHVALVGDVEYRYNFLTPENEEDSATRGHFRVLLGVRVSF
jgi:hypothetical protein